jgi:hypothetical protein
MRVSDKTFCEELPGYKTTAVKEKAVTTMTTMVKQQNKSRESRSSSSSY